MRETRARIVDLLRRRGPLTVEDLASALHVTRTAVVGHLAALQADGFVARRGLRPGSRRPAVLYGLTPAADTLFPKAYEEFAALVLADLKRRSPGHLRRLLRRIGDAWIARDLPRVAPLRGRDRLTRVTEILAERGFMPTLERTRTGYVLQEHNCPLMRLAADHVEVCDMVQRWLEALVGARLLRVRCLRQGDPCSAYALGAPAEGSRTMRTPPRQPGAAHDRRDKAPPAPLVDEEVRVKTSQEPTRRNQNRSSTDHAERTARDDAHVRLQRPRPQLRRRLP